MLHDDLKSFRADSFVVLDVDECVAVACALIAVGILFYKLGAW